jgi:hypothetical protein
VPKKYAVIGHLRETARGISGDHSEICKFGSASNEGYKAVVGALEDYVEKAKRTTTQGGDGNHTLTQVSVVSSENPSEATPSFAAHYGNNESGGVGIYGGSTFSGSTTIGVCSHGQIFSFH